VIALHCSLGSGRQWGKLAQQLDPAFSVIAPDIAGYGDNRGTFDLPVSLTEEIAALRGLEQANGPVHLVGHSYGGAIAFKMATASPFAARLRSLTLIEPVLPTLLDEDDEERNQFALLSRNVSSDLSNRLPARAIDRFVSYWNGTAPAVELPPEAQGRMLACIDKIPCDFTAAFDELNVAAAAATIRVPTLLVSGGQSPGLTQRIVDRLSVTIPGAETRHVLTAGHMLPITHARLINPEIATHIGHADGIASDSGRVITGSSSVISADAVGSN
jgi:pimeloyl-ACP methyl ester carboxylesterase